MWAKNMAPSVQKMGGWYDLRLLFSEVIQVSDMCDFPSPEIRILVFYHVSFYLLTCDLLLEGRNHTCYKRNNKFGNGR